MMSYAKTACLGLMLCCSLTPVLAQKKAAPPPKKAATETPEARQKRVNALLLQAIQKRDMKETLAALRAGADVNQKDKAGTPLLSLAIAKSFNHTIEELSTDSSVDAEAMGERFMSLAMSRPTEDTTPPLIVSLLKTKVDVNATDAQGRTPLMIAAAYLKTDTVKSLIQAGANVNARTKRGITALMISAISSDLPTTAVLVKAGADPNGKDDGNFDALLYSIMGPAPQLPVIQTIADATGAERKMAIEAYPKMYGIGIFDVLMASGAKPTAATPDGYSILHRASFQTPTRIVKQLLEAGIPIDIKGTHGTQGMTPLMAAVYYGRTDNARLLLEAGANPAASDSEGDTVLHYAAFFARYTAAEMLLAKGVDRTLKNKDGQTPLDYAREKKYTALVVLLEK